MSIREILIFLIMTGESQGNFFFGEERGFIGGMRKMAGQAAFISDDLVAHRLFKFFPVMALITEFTGVCCL